jgi:3-methyladenine DNA glycosylase AlkD
MASPDNVRGMARFGISVEGALGVPMPALRKLGRELGTDHALSLALWKTAIHEARILAALVGDPELLTAREADAWVRDLDSWDVCDQLCMNLLDRTPFAYEKAAEWSWRKREFEKRAGFALMAVLAVHDKAAPDSKLAAFLAVIEREATDERNFVRKAVNWALRQIGKRSPGLKRKAVAAAKRIAKLDSKPARWIACDALRELEGVKKIVKRSVKRFVKKSGKKRAK